MTHLGALMRAMLPNCLAPRPSSLAHGFCDMPVANTLMRKSMQKRLNIIPPMANHKRFHARATPQDLIREPAEAVNTNKSQSNEIDWSKKEPCGTLVCKQMPWMASEAQMQQMRNWHHSLLLQLWRATFSQLLSLQIRCIRNSLQNRVLGSTWFNWEAKAMHFTAVIFRVLRTSHRPDTNMHQFHTNLWPSKASPSACIV